MVMLKMGLGLETDAILAYSIGLLILYFLGSTLFKVFKIPVRLIVSIFINSIIGGLLLLLLNMFNFDIGVNPWNALVIGILGIPGLILLIVLKLLLAV